MGHIRGVATGRHRPDRISGCTIPVTVAALLAATVTGCAPAARHPAPALPATDSAVLQLAEQVSLRDCLARAGFRYRVTDAVPGRQFPYVIDDVAWAGVHGYGTDLRRAAEQARRRDPNQRYFRELPPHRRAAALAAANGTHPDTLRITTPDGLHLSLDPRGCRWQAEQRLYGDLRAWFTARAGLDALADLRVRRVLADPRYAGAVVPWARCMHAAGYRYRSPQRSGAAATDPSHPLPHGAEVRQAVTEARCARSSGLADTAAALDHGYEKSLNRRYRTLVRSYHQLRAAALPRARSIIRHERSGS